MIKFIAFMLGNLVFASSGFCQKVSFMIHVVRDWQQGHPLQGVDIRAKNYQVEGHYQGGDTYTVEVIGARPGQTIYLQLFKDGYGVVNWHQLQTPIPIDAILEPFILCEEKDMDKCTAQYYELKMNELVNKKILELQSQMVIASQKKEGEQIVTKLSGIMALLENRSFVENLAASLAQTKQDETDSSYQIALNSLITGNEDIAKALLSRKRLDAEAALIDAKEQQLSLEKAILANKYSLKGDIDFLDLDITSAIEDYQRAFKYNPSNFQTIQKLEAYYLLRKNKNKANYWIDQGLSVASKDDDDRLYHMVFLYQKQVFDKPTSITQFTRLLKDSTDGLRPRKVQSIELLKLTLAMGYMLGGDETSGLAFLNEAFLLDSNLRFQILPYVVSLYMLRNEIDKAEAALAQLLAASASNLENRNPLYEVKYMETKFNYGFLKYRYHKETNALTTNFFDILEFLKSHYSAVGDAQFIRIALGYVGILYPNQDTKEYEKCLKRILSRLNQIPEAKATGSLSLCLINTLLFSYYDDEAEDSTSANRYLNIALSSVVNGLDNPTYATFLSGLLQESDDYVIADSIQRKIRMFVLHKMQDSSGVNRDKALTLLLTALHNEDSVTVFSKTQLDSLIRLCLPIYDKLLSNDENFDVPDEMRDEAADVAIEFYKKDGRLKDAMVIATHRFDVASESFATIESMDESVRNLKDVLDLYIGEDSLEGAVAYLDKILTTYMQKAPIDSLSAKYAAVYGLNGYLYIFEHYAAADSVLQERLTLKMETIFSSSAGKSFKMGEQLISMDVFRQRLQTSLKEKNARKPVSH